MRKPAASALLMTGIHSIRRKNPFWAWSVTLKMKLPTKPPSAKKITHNGQSGSSSVHHAVHDEQQADAGVSERRGERRGINQAGQRPLLKKLALQVQNQAGDANDDGRPANKMSQPAPRLQPGLRQRPDCRDKQQRRNERKNQRHIFRRRAKGIYAVRQKNVRREPGQVEQRKQLNPHPRAAKPLEVVFGTPKRPRCTLSFSASSSCFPGNFEDEDETSHPRARILRTFIGPLHVLPAIAAPPPSFRPCAGGWDNCRATAQNPRRP